MRMGALEQFNSRYRDIDIGDSQEIRSALSQIPEELLSRATIAEHGTEMRTDRLVCQQSTAMDTSNEDFSTENAVEKSSDNPFAYKAAHLSIRERVMELAQIQQTQLS